MRQGGNHVRLRGVATALCAAVVLVSLFGGAAGSGAAQATEIDACTDITSPGHYVLTEDVTDAGDATCITVASGDVVLDGQGHLVDGVGDPLSTGIHVDAAATGNVTVENVAVTDWDDGVRVEGDDATLSGIAATDNEGEGIEVSGASGVRIEESTAADNGGDGVSLGGGTADTAVVDTVVRNNTQAGVGITTNAGTDEVVNVTAVDNGFEGVAAVDSTVEVRASAARANDGDGVAIANGGGNVTDTTVADNGGDGVLVDGFTAGVTVDGVDATGNAGAGVGLRETPGGAPDDTAIVDSEVSANRHGVVAAGATNTTVTNLTAVDNDRDGLRITEGSAPVVADSRFERNHNGVNATASARAFDVDVSGSVIADNDAFGVRNGATAGLNATENYWGAADGPASRPASDQHAPFRDPVTGAPADGSGDPVSEYPFVATVDLRGVSNVQFDPFLAAPPDDSGSAPLALTGCRVLDRPDRTYVLTTDLTDRGQSALNDVTIGPNVVARACILVTADNVTVEGGGHLIDGTDGGSQQTQFHGVAVANQSSNVTVRNATVTDWNASVAVRQGTDDTTIRDVRARDSVEGVSTDTAGTVTLDGVVAADNDRVGAFFFQTEVVVRDSVARNNGPATPSRDFLSGGVRTGGFVSDEGLADVRFDNATATGNGGPGIAVVRSHDDVRITDGTVSDNAVGMRLSGFLLTDLSLADNVVTGNDGPGIYTDSQHPLTLDGDVIADNGAGVVVETESGHQFAGVNVSDNAGDGIRLDTAEPNATITASRIDGNGVGVNVTAGTDVSTTEIHGSTVANNTRGIDNADDTILNATGNYWGAADGPASAPAGDPDAPFEDPLTGALADGGGDSVSEGPSTPGVSNVRFDAALASDPLAGAVHWQVDLGAGEVPDPPAYAPDDLVAALGNSEAGVLENPSVSRQTTDGQLGDVRIETDGFAFDDPEDPTEVTVRVTVEEGAETRQLHLAVFALPGPFDYDEIGEQELHAVETVTVEGGETVELTVPIPQAD